MGKATENRTLASVSSIFSPPFRDAKPGIALGAEFASISMEFALYLDSNRPTLVQARPHPVMVEPGPEAKRQTKTG